MVTVRGEDFVFLILTDWGLSVRKSKIQLHRLVLKPNEASLVVSRDGMMVLKAEFPATNGICPKPTGLFIGQ